MAAGGGGPLRRPINEPLPFITFIADHPLGTEVEGEVEGFTSHGAFVIAGGARCYAPVSGLGDPPPRSAKEMLTKGEMRTFVIQALDPPRRGIELALPGLAKVAGAPTEETVEAEIDVGAQPRSARRYRRRPGAAARRRRRRRWSRRRWRAGAGGAGGAGGREEASPAQGGAGRGVGSGDGGGVGGGAGEAPVPARVRRGRKAAPPPVGGRR